MTESLACRGHGQRHAGNRLSTAQSDTGLATGETLSGVTTRYSFDHLGHLLSTRTAAVNERS